MKLEQIRPVNNVILVELPAKTKEDDAIQKSESGIIIATTKKNQHGEESIVKCEVLAVDIENSLDIDKGSYVLVNQYAGKSIIIEGRACLLLDCSKDILAIVD